MSAEALFVHAEHPPDSAEATVRYSRRLPVAKWKPVVGVLVGAVGLLLVLLACVIFCRWRRRHRLMKKTVKDFSSGLVDIEAQTGCQTSTNDPSRSSSGGNPPAHPPVVKLGTRQIANATPPSPHSSSSSEKGQKVERSTASALLSTPTSQKPPKGLAPSPPIPIITKLYKVEAREAAALPSIPIKNIKTKQNRVEEGTASPMTVMSTEAPSSIRGAPPTRWEHETVDLVQAAEHKRKTSLAGKAPGGIAAGGDSCATRLQRKRSSFERARGAIIGYDLDIPLGTHDSASGSVAIDGPRSAAPAAPSNSVRDPTSTRHPPHPNMRSDSACGSVYMDGPRTSRRSTDPGGNLMRDASAPSQRSFNGSGVGGRRTLGDAGVFESFASLPSRDDTFDISSSANTASAAWVNASSTFAAPDSENTSPVISRKTRHLPTSPISGLFREGCEGVRPRVHTIEGDAIVPEGASAFNDLRATLRHRRSKTDFPSPRGGGIDFRWDSASGSAFRESGADNFCSGCLGTGVLFDSAAGSVFPPSSTGTPGSACHARSKSSGRFDDGSSPMVVYGDDVDGVDVENVERGGVRCYCVREPAARFLGEEKRTMHGGRQRSFSVSALPHEGSLSHLFGKE